MYLLTWIQNVHVHERICFSESRELLNFKYQLPLQEAKSFSIKQAMKLAKALILLFFYEVLI